MPTLAPVPADPTEVPLSDEDDSTQASRAASEILRKVASLELAPGTSLTERELAELVGVAKAPVREALLRIRSYGVIQPKPGSGYVVTPITLRRARGLLEHWAVLLSGAAAAIVRKGGGHEPTEMPAQHEEAIVEALGGREIGSELLWTLLVLSRLANEVIGQSFNILGIEVQRLLRFALSRGATFPGPESRAELEAALAGDDEWAAAAAAVAHVGAIEDAVLRALLTSDAVQDQNLAES